MSQPSPKEDHQQAVVRREQAVAAFFERLTKLIDKIERLIDDDRKKRI